MNCIILYFIILVIYTMNCIILYLVYVGAEDRPGYSSKAKWIWTATQRGCLGPSPTS